jgi:hypothetical protein
MSIFSSLVCWGGLFALSPYSTVPAQYIDRRFASNTLYIVVGSFKKDTTQKALGNIVVAKPSITWYNY